MEQRYNAPVETVFDLLTNAKWLEARCLAVGELSAKVKAKKAGKKVAVSMTRRIKRDLPALVAKVLSSESDLQFEEIWSADEEGGYQGTLAMDIVGQPVTMSAEFSLVPSDKGCIYRIEHKAKCSIPLLGGPVAKFALGQIEQGCADEFAYLVGQLKKKP